MAEGFHGPCETVRGWGGSRGLMEAPWRVSWCSETGFNHGLEVTGGLRFERRGSDSVSGELRCKGL